MQILFLNLFLLLAVGISVLGDILAKSWASGRGVSLAVIAFILYSVSSILWLLWLPHVRLSIAIFWWQAFAVILTSLVGIFYFKEKIGTLETMAMLLIFGGIIILSFKHA